MCMALYGFVVVGKLINLKTPKGKVAGSNPAWDTI
jgi:hypothetical protein